MGGGESGTSKTMPLLLVDELHKVRDAQVVRKAACVQKGRLKSQCALLAMNEQRAERVGACVVAVRVVQSDGVHVLHHRPPGTRVSIPNLDVLTVLGQCPHREHVNV